MLSQLTLNGYGPEVAERILNAIHATRRQAIRLRMEPVGEKRRRRSLGELLSGKHPSPPPEMLPRAASKVGGLPWLEQTAQWPRNARGKALELVVQLRFSDLPRHPELPTDGVLSVFRGYSPDVFGVLWFPEIRGEGAAPPDDAPPPAAKRESRLNGTLFSMYDLPSALSQQAGLRPEDSDIESTVFEWIHEINEAKDGEDHVLLGHPGEHRDLENRAKAALAERSGVVRKMNHSYVSPDLVARVELERFRLLLTMSFDLGFTPFGDNDLRLLIRDDDLAAHRLEAVAPLIHVVG